ncbi:MAG TPA: carboxylate-amine ligase, partial [Pseudomonadota bacterium]|nr:carboxylate-amine ligase [Pseudomonadota bacterium]
MVDIDAPVTEADLGKFRALQAHFSDSYAAIFNDPLTPRTVLIVPSLSLDQDVVAKVRGAHHYEERMLCLLLLLRMPRTQLIYVTSTPIPETIIDYYLHLLPGVPGLHARRRLTLLACDDASPIPLTRKILERPRLLQLLRETIANPTA